MISLVIGSPSHAGKRSIALLVLWILLCGLTGCLVRHRQKIPAATLNEPVWQTASRQDLLQKIQTQQNAIRTLDATATIEPSVSSPLKGEIINYRDVRAFILLRQPAMIRVIGLYPVLQNKAFDMTSDGETFRLYIAAKNRFIIGKSHNGEHRSKSGLQNLRPQHILDALLVKGPEPGKEVAVLEAHSEAGSSYYIIHILRTTLEQWPVLARNIWFERRGLSVARLQMFDDNGEEVTDVLYGDYTQVSGIPYPREIVIHRPKDFYDLRLLISDLKLNQPIGDEKFFLEQPPGTVQMNLDQQSLPKNEGNGG